MSEYESVNVWNVTNGNRIETYALHGKPGEFCLNGAAAHKFNVDDVIIVSWWKYMHPLWVKNHKPNIILLDTETNKPKT